MKLVNVINWKLFFILLISCVVTSILVLPYTLSISNLPSQKLPRLALAQSFESIVEFSIAILIGLYLMRKVGFDLPILNAWLAGKKDEAKRNLRSILRLSVGLGVLATALITVLSLLYVPFHSLVQQSGVSVPLWQSFLAIFYGGVGEETLFRLFLMTLLVWISFKIKKTSSGKPTSLGIWLAIIISAIIFGLGHLPVASTYVSINTTTITEAIVNNGIVGIICGWLYWKKGFESAMIAHFSADVVLHLIVPFILSWIV